MEDILFNKMAVWTCNCYATLVAYNKTIKRFQN